MARFFPEFPDFEVEFDGWETVSASRWAAFGRKSRLNRENTGHSGSNGNRQKVAFWATNRTRARQTRSGIQMGPDSGTNRDRIGVIRDVLPDFSPNSKPTRFARIVAQTVARICEENHQLIYICYTIHICPRRRTFDLRPKQGCTLRPRHLQVSLWWTPVSSPTIPDPRAQNEKVPGIRPSGPKAATTSAIPGAAALGTCVPRST